MKHVLYWDIDGTLLTTGRAGVPALEDGVELVVGVRPRLTDMQTAGLTDRMIAREILVALGRPPDDAVERAILTAYTDALPARLLERRGGVLPGVRELLDALATEDVLSVLLTGNMKAGAAAKLASYGLDGYFTAGAFADDGFDRASIARHAITTVTELLDAEAAASGVIVGDTPLDVACGAETGLRVLAVASGAYSTDVLSECGAWWVLDRLPEPADLLARLRAPDAAAQPASPPRPTVMP